MLRTNQSSFKFETTTNQDYTDDTFKSETTISDINLSKTIIEGTTMDNVNAANINTTNFLNSSLSTMSGVEEMAESCPSGYCTSVWLLTFFSIVMMLAIGFIVMQIYKNYEIKKPDRIDIEASTINIAPSEYIETKLDAYEDGLDDEWSDGWSDGDFEDQDEISNADEDEMSHNPSARLLNEQQLEYEDIKLSNESMPSGDHENTVLYNTQQFGTEAETALYNTQQFGVEYSDTASYSSFDRPLCEPESRYEDEYTQDSIISNQLSEAQLDSPIKSDDQKLGATIKNEYEKLQVLTTQYSNINKLPTKKNIIAK